MILEDYGYRGEMEFPDGLLPARIVAEHKGMFEAVCAQGFVRARVKASEYGERGAQEYPATGDEVALRINPSGESLIVRTLPRRSQFVRSDFSGHAAGYVKTIKRQVIAANFDTAFILCSLNRDFNLQRVARYLVVVRESGAEPVVLLTKRDLVDDVTEQEARAKKEARGAPVYCVSAVTGEGLSALDAYVRAGRTGVFLGSSGVGKSSLINALAGEELMDTGEIREHDARGRHTTTHRQILRLPSGALVIDTPGMRELGMWDAREGLRETYADIEALAAQCRFGNCRHGNEPGCAVRRAIESGALDARRLDGYRKLTREQRFVNAKKKPGNL